ncbi:MAG: helix-turn-helix domain-containing protein [Bacteroidetes bacterium]|nr:helix-turn-helix domain-containing protein [Bacteroidota bacterium]
MLTSNLVVTLSIDDFSHLIKKVVREELSSLYSVVSTIEPVKEQFNYVEAASYLKVSKPTFSKLRKEGKIPSYQVSENRVIFLKSDLDNFIFNQKQKKQ